MKMHATIHATFDQVAGSMPDRIAVADDVRQVSYAEVARRSDRVADQLVSRGLGNGDHIGLFTQRSIDAVIAMLGILKAGGAYVPFDPAYPFNQLRFVYEDCAPALMLIEPGLLADPGLCFWSGPALDLHEVAAGAKPAGGEPAAPSATRAAVTPDDLAYIMYTSGSTGHPKGVRIPHRGVTRLVIENPFVELGPAEVHLQLAPLAFDASTFEIWGALLNGAKLGVVTLVHPSLDDVAAHIALHGVTTLWLTAGLFHLMVDHRLEGLAPLRQLLAGGDVLSPSHVARARRALPRCRLINGYGPTENTTFTCCYTIPAGGADGPIPIGTPIAHTQVYVLDETGTPVRDGMAGELYAGGAGLALGYLNRPELDAERFVANPFDATQGTRLYRTGDRVRRREDGNFEFLGRVDRQVKINGKRVELDEIEATLRRSPLLEDAAVTAPAVAGRPRKIYAFVKPRQPHADLLEKLREHVRQELPEHMMPAAFVVLDALPLSPTGKVDRARLTLPDAMPGAPAAGAARGNALETRLIEIWRTVLDLPALGVEDNFFDLGGTSLQLLQVHATIVADMKSDLTVVDLFQYPRISALAAHIAGRGSTTARGVQGAATAGHGLSADERAGRQRAALARARVAPRPRPQ